MAITQNGILQTYGDSATREDVVFNALEYTTPAETQLLRTLGPGSPAISTVHSYLVDTYPAAASQAVAESSDYTVQALTTPTRQTNRIS